MVLAILQARTSSNRLPGKVMRPILGEPMLAWQIERVRRAKHLSGLVVATSARDDDQPIADLCASLGVDCFRGDLNDVLGRFLAVLDQHPEAVTFARLTGDCPLTDPELIDRLITEHFSAGAENTNLHLSKTYPKGLDVEICQSEVLRRIDGLATGAHREHVTSYIYAHPHDFRIHSLSQDPPWRVRWTVDTPEDFAFVTEVYEAFYPANPAFTSTDIMAWQQQDPSRIIPCTD